jgi:hypothetical protein
MIENTPACLALIQESQLPENLKTAFIVEFSEILATLHKTADLAFTLKVDSLGDTEIIAASKDAFKHLTQIKNQIEEKRKYLKAPVLSAGTEIDRIAKTLQEVIEPALAHLEQQAKYELLLKKKAKEELHKARAQKLTPYANFIPVNKDYSSMKEADFEQLLQFAITAKENHEEAEKLRLERIKLEQQKKDQEAQELALLREKQHLADAEIAQLRKDQEAELARVRKENDDKAAAERARLRLEIETEIRNRPLPEPPATQPATPSHVQPIQPAPQGIPTTMPPMPTSNNLPPMVAPTSAPVQSTNDFDKFINHLESVPFYITNDAKEKRIQSVIETQLKQLINWAKAEKK